MLALLLATALAGDHVVVDAFGYRPDAAKVAVLRQPVVGWDAPSSFTPGPRIEVRRVSDDAVVLHGPPVAWRGGAVHAASGDRVWHFGLSALTTPGTYVVVDPATGARSEAFRVGHDVYDEVLAHAVRAFTLQRCGAEKHLDALGPDFADAACHLGAGQDRAAVSAVDPRPQTARDLHGGWHDAGDYNKYVNFADDPVHWLLDAWESHPALWTDDLGIPESGNGFPDLLDEVDWELSWLLRMQQADGSVLHKVSVDAWQGASPPSADTAPRRYGPPTASATASAAGVFAHAAVTFRLTRHPHGRARADVFAAAARAAWDWLQAHPSTSAYDNAGFQSADAEDDPYTQRMNRLRAAAWLFRLTGEARYRQAFDAGYREAHLFAWSWASPWEVVAQDALLAYTQAPGATPAVVDDIRRAWAADLRGSEHLGSLDADPYAAFLPDADHGWGTHRTKALQGVMLASMHRYGVDAVGGVDWLDAASGYAHYLHGVNPQGRVMLTAMGRAGAERSATEMYHLWFGDGTPWDSALTSPIGPPPGFVTGGVNPSYAPDPAYAGPRLAPPLDQPILKAYRDWNTSWPENSWEITEPAIYYQAAYVRLLTELAAPAPHRIALDVPTELVAGQTATFRVANAAPGKGVVVLVSPRVGRFQASAGPWCLDLGIAMNPRLKRHLVHRGKADARGEATFTVTVPAWAAGRTLVYQAAQAGTCPTPRQSAVIRRGVR